MQNCLSFLRLNLEIYEKKVTPYGNGAKIDVQKKYIGKRVFVIVLKD